MENRYKLIWGFATAAIIAMAFVTVVTIAADLNLALKDWLKATFSHHWLGKGVLAAVIFVLGGVLLGNVAKRTGVKQVQEQLALLFWVTTVGAVALIAFFAYEAFLK